MLLDPSRPEVCRSCLTTRYTWRELHVSPGQAGRCYRCFDAARGNAPTVANR